MEVSSYMACSSQTHSIRLILDVWMWWGGMKSKLVDDPDPCNSQGPRLVTTLRGNGCSSQHSIPHHTPAYIQVCMDGSYSELLPKVWLWIDDLLVGRWQRKLAEPGSSIFQGSIWKASDAEPDPNHSTITTFACKCQLVRLALGQTHSIRLMIPQMWVWGDDFQVSRW